MKKLILPGCILFWAMAALAIAQSQGQLLTSFSPGPSTAAFHEINGLFTGDWQQYGQLFTSLQSKLFSQIFLLVITVVPLIFLLHYIVIGPMVFSHEGKQVYYFNLFARCIHWVAGISFALLVITGLLIIFGSWVGGGTLPRSGRIVHLISAVVFSGSAVFMLLIWAKDMIFTPYDFLWMLILGGYLSKEKKPVPAGRFNAGQKCWFWLATMGGAAMAVTGYFLYSFQGSPDTLRLSAIIHNALGAVMVAVFFVHLYMSLFAIKGAIHSMISGYKPEAELKILHPRFKI
ncbi:MAG: formate dehydrogenase subunit gamma [Proteobacteria bacterium]|nr:formate dehydrogenase subunit gamma [Pseudomonadota bacterium]